MRYNIALAFATALSVGCTETSPDMAGAPEIQYAACSKQLVGRGIWTQNHQGVRQCMLDLVEIRSKAVDEVLNANEENRPLLRQLYVDVQTEGNSYIEKLIAIVESNEPWKSDVIASDASDLARAADALFSAGGAADGFDWGSNPFISGLVEIAEKVWTARSTANKAEKDALVANLQEYKFPLWANVLASGQHFQAEPQPPAEVGNLDDTMAED